VYFETGQNTLALEFYRLSIPYLKKEDHYRGLSENYLGLARVFEKNKQNDSALYYAKQSLLLANGTGITIQVRDAARFLSHYYRKFNADSAFYTRILPKPLTILYSASKKAGNFKPLPLMKNSGRQILQQQN